MTVLFGQQALACTCRAKTCLTVPEELHKFGPACISSNAFDLHSHTALQPFFSAAPASHADS